MIERSLRKLYNQTVYTAENIAEAEENELIALIALRNGAMSDLEQKEQVNEEEKQMIRDILSYDEIIVGRMNEIKDDAALQLRKIRQYHMQSKAYSDNKGAAMSYNNPYSR
ncbi:hypothetical protein ACE3MZ_20630 [Paenibacillus sp. WLX1005]|uniref:hypothetical protein n=1 Tax=Paenibacillus sp. WLX1005 TaxID=3243766 RepID=UPI0039844676